MDRSYLSGASGTAPTPPAVPSIGYPTAGSPGVSPATTPGPYLYHMLIEELLAIVTAGGLTPAQGTLNQVLQALPGALASRPEMARSLSTNGYQKLPGGLIIQCGTASNVNNQGSGYSSATFPIAFPVACLNIVTSSFTSGPSYLMFSEQVEVSSLGSKTGFYWVSYTSGNVPNATANSHMLSYIALGC